MSVNLLKTVELVFQRPNIPNDLLPSVMTNVRRVGAAKLLGVHLTQNVTFSQHIDVVVTVCNQRLPPSTTEMPRTKFKCAELLFLMPLLPIKSYMHYLFTMDI